jgi:hypothetical protein
MFFYYLNRGKPISDVICISCVKYNYTFRNFSSNQESKKNITGNKSWFEDSIRDALDIYPLQDIDYERENYSMVDVDNLFKKARKYKWILQEWNKDNPQNKLDSTEKIIQLSSRFKKFAKWYEEANEKYSAINSAPTWLTEYDPDNAVMWTESIREKLEMMSEANTKRAKAIQSLARERKTKMQTIDESFTQEIVDIVHACPEVGIEMLTVDSLPISDQIKIYEIGDGEKQKEVIKSKLIDFKTDRYKKLNEGVINSNDIVQLLLEKL